MIAINNIHKSMIDMEESFHAFPETISVQTMLSVEKPL